MTRIRRFMGITIRHRPNRRFAGLSIAMGAVFGAVLYGPTAGAVTPIAQTFTTKDKLSTGSIVSLKSGTSDTVNAASSANVESILGVVISDGSSLLTLTSNESSQVSVATSGVVTVLVSDINGAILQGDQITASPVNGVGMKATSSAKVVGIAQAGLKTDNSNKQTYKDSAGKEQTMQLGQVPVLVNVSYFYKQPEKTLVPSAIQNVANAMAGRPVNALPIFVSMGIFIVTMIIVMSMIYSMIRSSIISVGRNPMSQSAIYRDLLQLSALVIVIISVGMASIYMVLTRL